MSFIIKGVIYFINFKVSLSKKNKDQKLKNTGFKMKNFLKESN